jgi:myo-inositol-1(or 4)-monophosphatase
MNVDQAIDSNLSIAIHAARRAENVFKKRGSEGIVLQSRGGNGGKEWKVDLDFQLEREIIAEISSKSSLPILSEESIPKDHLGASYWVVDPLDGSANCLRGIPICATSIALWHENRPVLGVVLDLIRNELYYGSNEFGAWCNDSQIYVSEENLMENAILNTGFPSALNINTRYLTKMTPFYKSFGKVRMFGSAALSLAFVACGKSDSYFEEGIAIWDVAAGLALVRAAGGVVNIEWSNYDKHRLMASAAASESLMVL